MTQIDVLTLFPDMIKPFFSNSIISRAISKELINIEYYQIRDYTLNKQNKVDDYTYGGGPGLIMSYQPISDTFKHIYQKHGDIPYRIYMSPQGKPLTQKLALEISKKQHIAVLCGHYEGVDERVIDEHIDCEISVGDYVLTGGEIPACVLIDCFSRLIPGVLSTDESSEKESHTDLLLEYPQYTRPEIIDGRQVPAVLLSGNHSQSEQWRKEESVKRTKRKRPDLYKQYELREYRKNTYYFDNSATTCQLDSVTEKMRDIAQLLYGNPSSLHRMGMLAENELKESRNIIAEFIGASMDEIFFTSGGSESNNQAIKAYLSANKRRGNKVIISAGEHPSVKETCLYMESKGAAVCTLPLNDKGIINIEDLKKELTEDTVLVSIMHVNSETGAVSPIEDIIKTVKSFDANIAVHADCVQSFGKIDINVTKLGIDMISVSAHKVHGPRGIGFIYVKKGTKMDPLIHGGGQEGAMRSGTENLPAIAGFAQSVIALKECKDRFEHVKEIRDIFVSRITESIHSCVVISDTQSCVPNVLNLAFPGLRAEVILHSVEVYGVYISVGSACSSHKKNRSYVLTSMGYQNNVIDGSIRISISYTNTKEQAEYAAKVLCTEIKKLYASTVRSRRGK